MIRLEALDWLRAVTMETPSDKVSALIGYMLSDKRFGPYVLTDDEEILELAEHMIVVHRMRANRTSTMMMDRTCGAKAGDLLTLWTATGSNDGWPKAAVNNCHALRIIIAAYRAAEVQTSAYEVWIHCITSENAEAFSWESARRLQEILGAKE